MTTKSLVGVFTGSLLVATALTPARAADMTTERLLNPQREPQNWILHHGNYQGHRFSALKEIDTSSIKNLRLAYTVALSGFQSGGRYAFGNLEATPIVEDGMMYVPDGWGSVYAIDVSAGRKGTIKWKMDPGTDRAWAGDVACCGVNNRGVALWKDKVISIALDGRMFAIDKATGEVVWERKVADPALGETLTVAPLVVRDLAIVGAAGGEFGIRGYIDATDLNTGKATWRTYTIPGAGEPGNETWKDGKERWKHGGGSVWETATYDPESDTFYQGIGNAGPDYDIAYRPGDNKWAASVLAISPNDGKIKWGFQYTPQDPYDYDEISEHPIINAKVNGEDRKLVVHAARNGFFYALDRTNGTFVAGKQYVDQLTWTTGLDPKTGRPLNYDPNSDIQIYTPGSHGMLGQPAGRTCPTNSGGKNWEPTAYNPSSACSTSRPSKAATSSRRSSKRISPTRAAPSSRASASPAAAPRAPNAATAASRPSIRPPAKPKPISGSPIRTIRAPWRRPATSCSSATTTARCRPMTPRVCRRSGASTSAPASTRR
jgi:alcohol dehydrogenase (cytochrome c)